MQNNLSITKCSSIAKKENGMKNYALYHFLCFHLRCVFFVVEFMGFSGFRNED
jgi:hypothetical protein